MERAKKFLILQRVSNSPEKIFVSDIQQFSRKKIENLSRADLLKASSCVPVVLYLLKPVLALGSCSYFIWDDLATTIS